MNDKNIIAVTGTFIELVKLGDFEEKFKKAPKKKEKDIEPSKEPEDQKPSQIQHLHPPARLGISYTINLNLPATTEIEVFNAIFKSLKEHILDEK